jgi:hypothetical protein
MIRRNVAGQTVLLGPVTTTAGAPQSTGVTVYVLKDGSLQGPGAGTFSHLADGCWLYTPTQGETDCNVLSVILQKASCYAVPANLLTTRLPVQTEVSAAAATAASAFWGGLETGTAQAGAAGSITLAAGESAVTDFYKDMAVVIVGGTGAGQVRRVSAYNGTTKVATVSANWATTPDSTSVYQLLGRLE